jgi:hypothetical protein
MTSRWTGLLRVRRVCLYAYKWMDGGVDSYLKLTLPKTFRRVKSRSTFWPIFLLLIPGMVNSYSGRL